MSKYKVGDKVVMEITDKVEVMEEPNYILSDATVVNQGYIDKAAEPLSTYIEQARAEGQNEAWELARKIVSDIYHSGYNSDELKEMFGYFSYQFIWEDNTYPEAAAKVEAWEKAKEEICIGDVVRYTDGTYGAVLQNGHMLSVMLKDGSTTPWHKDCCRKTGRHIDIDSFLKQIGEE